MAVEVLAGAVVAHGCSRVGVAGGDLHVAEADAGVEHGRDEGVAQHVRVHSRRAVARRGAAWPCRHAAVPLGGAGGLLRHPPLDQRPDQHRRRHRERARPRTRPLRTRRITTGREGTYLPVGFDACFAAPIGQFDWTVRNTRSQSLVSGPPSIRHERLPQAAMRLTGGLRPPRA